MPTFHTSVLKHQERESDHRFPVSIRITHNRKSAYIKTDYYVSKQQLNKKYEIKDTTLLRILLDLIGQYEELLFEIGNKMSDYTAKDLADFIRRKKTENKDLDFIQFARGRIEELKKQNRNGRATHLTTSLNSFQDFVGGTYNINDINSELLRKFERFLRSERKIIRKDQFGSERVTVQNPVTDTGVNGYMSDLRALFNIAVEMHNDEDGGEIRIKNNPFRRYKIPPENTPQKRNIRIEDIRKINDLPSKGIREDLGRDIFMLSFFLAGMNSVDLYNIEFSCLSEGRLTYCRSKTKNRRDDSALISIKIQPEMEELLKKYADPDKKRVCCFYNMYSSSANFNAAINRGLKQVAKDAGIKMNLTYYVARHSVATIARNQLNVPMDDVALLLNHVSEEHRTTDIYVEKDFSRIDAVIRKLIDLLYEVKKER